MPSTPIYGITYPCLSPVISPTDFATLATTTEAALDTVGFSATPGGGEAYAVTHTGWGRGLGAVTPLVGVEGTFNFVGAPTSVTFGGGIVVFPASGNFTTITSGFYMASVSMGGISSTLTMTSNRVAVYVNGVLYAAKKTRGLNPVFAAPTTSTFDVGVNLTAADIVTFRYLWTGTGVLNGPASATVSLSLLTRT